MEHINIMLYLGAMTLGAFHAFEPGHGKTIIAAYMIGTRGRALDGILLGLIVTFTHTFSVIALGILAKVLSRTYSEASLHSWLGLFSAVLILSVGLWMLKTRLSGKSGHSHVHLFGGHHDHSHDNHHDHDHEHIAATAHHHESLHVHPHDHDHDHEHDHDHSHEDNHDHSHNHNHDHDHDHPQDFSFWNLLLLGISGGLVPCPAGIATLLAAIAAGRIAEGLVVTIFFSLGLGLVMMSIGVLLSQAGRLTQKISDNIELGHRLGVLSAVIISILGVVTLVHSLRSIL